MSEKCLSDRVSESDEKEAREWLDKKISEEYAGAWPGYMKHARTIKRLLAEPRLPKEPTREMLQAMWSVWLSAKSSDPAPWDGVYRALYAHLTASRTKEVEVDGWAVVGPDGYVGVFQRTKEDAETWLWRCKEGSTIVRLTGKATVPA